MGGEVVTHAGGLQRTFEVSVGSQIYLLLLAGMELGVVW